MDRRVKERLVGASILVTLFVLIVPELLSGPPPTFVSSKTAAGAPQPVRNVTMDLATSKPTTSEQALDPAGASSAQPAQPQEPPAVNSTASTDTPKAAPRSAAPAAVETAPPVPTSSTTAAKPVAAGHAWALQLGSFANRANADKLARQLKAQGFPVYVNSGGSGRALRYRVRVGPMVDRNAANRAAAKLKSAGHIASLVPAAP